MMFPFTASPKNSAVATVKGREALGEENQSSRFTALVKAGKCPAVGWGGGANPPAPDWTSAHPEGVFRALPPSSGRRLRPRSPSPVPWRRRWRRRSKMKTATAAAGICASWTKACGGKGRSAARSGPRIPLAGAELYPDRAQMLSGFLPPYCAGTALLKCQVHRVLIPFLLGLLRAWKLPCILCQSLAILRLQWFFLYWLFFLCLLCNCWSSRVLSGLLCSFSYLDKKWRYGMSGNRRAKVYCSSLGFPQFSLPPSNFSFAEHYDIYIHMLLGSAKHHI